MAVAKAPFWQRVAAFEAEHRICTRTDDVVYCPICFPRPCMVRPWVEEVQALRALLTDTPQCVWILLNMTWACDDDDVPAHATVHVSRLSALQWLYGPSYGSAAARLRWRRVHAHYYEAEDPEDQNELWVLYEKPLDAEHDERWRRFGYTGDLPDLDHVSDTWPDDDC